MPFDQPTRNLLARFVSDARALLTEEFTRQLQQEYGLDPECGDVTDLSRLGHLDDARRATALLLRETLAYYLAGQPKPDAKARREALDRIVREQAFTILNRLCAVRMAEGRGLLIESVGQGYRSRGFQLYSHLASTGLGETGDAYRCYLLSLFDELALELPVLFDRYAPEGRLFPREVALSQVLALINAPEIAPLWAEDETIGWIYQYFNSVEERRQMRAESQAPRNSRELAVRNQFFTPRYVVEFLTDNTLGRIWYEMTRGETSLRDREACRYLVRRPAEIFLAEGETQGQGEGETGGRGDEVLSQEELLRQPVYIPHRPLKDPRDILMLDPACGSLHFGLYAFDLYERIYDEAWELEGILGPAAFIRSEGLLPLRESYPDKAAFLADVPRLIIERNIHGIDIDPRAVQIAGLSLWLRAQRSWQAQSVKPQDRPQIRCSNIVCAEPMPGDRALLEEFLKTLRDERLEGLIRRVLKTPSHQRVRATPAMADALCDLVRTVWKEMELAGEAGSLLKIEEALAGAVGRGKAEWDEKAPLFRVVDFGLTEQVVEKPKIRYAKSIPGEEDTDFWDRAEALVLAALEDYAERAENGGGYRRRLFADDAVRGFDFIDLFHTRFDVILMNPPFGASISGIILSWLKSEYPSTYSNLGAAFVQRSVSMLVEGGYLGAIIDIATSIRSSYSEYRYEVLYDKSHLRSYIHLGWNVLDANVEVCCFTTLGRRNALDQVFCVDASQSPQKGSLVAECVQAAHDRRAQTELFFASEDEFRQFPNGALNFTLPSELRRLFAKHPPLGEQHAGVKTGLSSGDNGRFYRLSWDVSETRSAHRWVSLSNGGEFLPFYRPFQEVIDWKLEGRLIKTTPGSFFRNESLYFRPGLSYGKRGVFLAVHTHPEQRIFTNEGQGIFPEAQTDPLFLLGILNSKVCRMLINEYCGQHKENGYVSLLPIPVATTESQQQLASIASRILIVLREEHKCEMEHAETVGLTRGLLRDGVVANVARMAHLKAELDRLEAEMEASVLKIYDLSKDSSDHIAGRVADCPSIYEAHFRDREETDFIARLLCDQLIGIAFGRWDVRYLTGEIETGPMALPFNSLAGIPPGRLSHQDTPVTQPVDLPQNYPISISWTGVIAADEVSAESLVRSLHAILDAAWSQEAGNIEQQLCMVLGRDHLGQYFKDPDGFFDDHLKRYSKSRRQAPIYWPLSTPSGSYTLWLYYHQLSDQTLYICVNDFVDPKLKQVSDDAGRLRQKRGRSSADEKELEQLAGLELELTDFRAELLRIAAFWKPNLNDGVQITAAPLWRLFQHRPWQKTLKETWESLERGEYDWAHLAMSIWPERVVPKCITDRSLAIAHDVEDLFWVEDGGRWRNLNPPDEELSEQVRRQQRPGRDQLRLGLAALTLGEGRGLRCEQVYEALATGKWDDLTPALLFWPERVAQKCWDDPLLAVTLKIDLPTKRTKAARERFIAARVAAGCPDLADALREALADRVDRFASLWAEMTRGDRDELALAPALWPDRVVDTCAKDVELAERHSLRRFLWVQDLSGVWRRRKALKEEVASEIARRQRKGA